MDKLFGDILTQGLTPGLTFELLKMLIIVLIVISIRNWMTNLVNRRLAYRKLRNDEYITEGAWVNWPTTTGSIDVEIDRITPFKVVLLATDRKTWIHVPILQFANGTVALLSTTPISK